MPPSRFLTRLFFFITTLLLSDILCKINWAEKIQAPFETAYRLPDNQEMALLPHYLDYLKTQKQKQNIVFLGSSPTYGVNIQNPQQTYPYAFENALKKKNPQSPAQVYNLGAKGLLLSDLAYILKATIHSGDLFIIQLNYHTFSPEFLKSTPIRHPDLPSQLNVPITYAEARHIGARPTPYIDLNAPLSQFLKSHWFFYRERERLALYWLNDSPEAWFYHLFFPKANAETPANTSQPFYELKPAQQVYIVKRYAQNAAFTITADNSEIFFLKNLLTQLQSQQKKAFFYLTPINVDGLNFYEVMPWQDYKKNQAYLKKTIEAAGFPFWDTNLSAPLPEEHFADISHTLDSGGEIVGQKLFEVVEQAGLL